MSTGCGTEVLGRRAWNVSPWRGQQAVFEIVDSARGGWGHIEVDELVQWRRR
jgi:fructan beta-fructosidase